MKLKVCSVLVMPFLCFYTLQAQDYLINFSGHGATSVVASVKIENLTQNTNLVVDGTDILHLVSSITGIEENIQSNTDWQITFSPNPMIDYSRMKFNLSESGNTIITLNDFAGKVILKYQKYLHKGQHTYGIKGINKGIYIISVRSGRHLINSKLVCERSGKGIPEIVYETMSSTMQEKHESSKGGKGDVEMKYNEGDILKFTGISGDYSTIITDVPISSKTVNFNFVACTDQDGNKYSVVVIGSAKGSEAISKSDDKGPQVWMGENLKTTTFNDKTDIPNVSNNLTWTTYSSAAYCAYNNVPNDMGLLYNWYAVGTGKLCPVGWHVPKESEWSSLIQYLGGKTIAGGKLKETATSHWTMGNSGATNSSGFTGLPGGCRLPTDGTFIELAISGYFWTSTGALTDYAYFYSLHYFCTIVYGGGDWGDEINMKHGLSVRCLKDDE